VSIPKILPLLVALAVLLPVHASVVTASGAGPLPASAQDLTGLFPTEIVGSITDPLGVNMFKLDIFTPQTFSATMIGSAFDIPDTELFLFDSTGHGVLANDDQDNFGNLDSTLACLPSAVMNPCSSPLPGGIGPLVSGIYYLAVTRSANLPIDASSLDLFTIVNSTDVVGPDPTQGGNNPIADWDNGAFASPNSDDVNYDIILTGTTPEPATWIMTGIAGLFLVLLRRALVAPGIR
jgi:hypothetical protein